MPYTAVPITISVNNQSELMKIADAIQTLVNRVGNDNLIKLSEKVKKNPALISTALKYI